MGTFIDLSVGVVEIDASKNSIGIHHGVLFREGDRTSQVSDQDEYDYCVEHGIKPLPPERFFSRSLKDMIPRLDLLGWTVEAAKAQFDRRVVEWQEYQQDEMEIAPADLPPPLEFSEFIEFLKRNPLHNLDDSYEPLRGSTIDSFMERFKTDPVFSRIPFSDESDGYSKAGYFASLVAMPDPYATLRILALVPENLESKVTWNYGILVDNGYAEESEFTTEVRREHTFLIATEGTSDIHILKAAISLLMPEVQDFFRFIDISERHPFSSTGGLVKFAEGLIKIDVQNRILFIFDNDAEGWAAFTKVQKYRLPLNMRAMVLPDLEVFRQFPTFGPDGENQADINRRAAAIECYLDLRLDGKPPARVRWTNYSDESKDYQGSLEFKESYWKPFTYQAERGLLPEGYDLSKLRIVLDTIFSECCAIASRM